MANVIYCPFCERTYPEGTILHDGLCCVSVKPILVDEKTKEPVIVVPEKICDIARMIIKDWRSQGKGINYAAKPYVEAMLSIENINDNFGYDSGVSIVRYFLCNANSWKGNTAREVKKKLNAMCKGK